MANIYIQGELERQKGIHYEVDPTVAPIGEGGMGIVRKGIQVNEVTMTTRPVAIKFLFDDLPPHAIERARREAGIQLRNDNLVEMLGFIEVTTLNPIGEPIKHSHVVSELLYGVSLNDILEGKCQAVDGKEIPFAVKMLHDYQNDPEHFAKVIVMNVLSGLMALHDAGYIHRDIDPTNIMLTEDGHIKLIDFGIAKQMNNLTTSDKSLTVSGSFMGKPEYASPELALGDVKSQNQTTDIYAVGILLYQCITGHTPFEGARHEVLNKQIHTTVPVKVIKDRKLRDVISIACDKKQELRYQSAAQMRVALESIDGSTRGISAKKKGFIGGIAAAVVIAICGISIAVKVSHDKAQQEAEQAQIAAQVAELDAKIAKDISNAESILEQANDIEKDNRHELFMEAYALYESIAKEIENAPEAADKTAEVNQKKSGIINQLKQIKEEYENTSNELSGLGETGLADEYVANIKKIEKFINEHK